MGLDQEPDRKAMIACHVAISFAIICLIASPIGGVPAFAGPNENTTLILHTAPGFAPSCDIADPCSTGAQVQIQKPGDWNVIYVVVRNYDSVRDVYLTATWDPDFNVVFGMDCFPGCLDCLWIDQFNRRLTWYASRAPGCQVGGESVVIGRLYVTPTAGCFTLVQSEYPEITSCQGETDRVQGRHLGRVCVGPGGIDACDGPVPVEPETWGAIKAQYQRELPR